MKSLAAPAFHAITAAVGGAFRYLNLFALRTSRGHKAALFGALVLFLLFALWDLKSPGIGRDEASMGYAAAGIDFLHALKNLSFERLPLQFDGHHGTWIAYSVYPFLKIISDPVVAMRLAMVLYSVLTLLCLYRLVFDLYGEGAALLSLSFLAFHPAFLLITRMGVRDGNLLLLFSVLAVSFLIRWWKGGRTKDFFLMCFTLGLGLGTLSWFIYWMAGLSATLLCFGRGFFRRLMAAWKSHVLEGGVCFLLGVGPLFLAMLFSDPPFFQPIEYLIVLWSGHSQGVGLSSLLVFQPQRSFAIFRAVLEGGYTFLSYYWDLSVGNLRGYYTLFLVSAGWLVARSVFRRQRSFETGLPLALVCLVFTTLLFASFEPLGVHPAHLLPILPWAVLICAIGVHDVCKAIPNEPVKRLVMGVVPGVVLVSVLFFDVEGYVYLHKTGGGTADNSGAVYDLAVWLKKRNPQTIMVTIRAVDRIKFLVSPAVQLKDMGIYVAATEEGTFQNLTKISKKIDVYVAPIGNHSGSPATDMFYLFNKWRKQQTSPVIRLKTVFYDRHGRPAYRVYEPQRS